jgi:hypothetical protein
LEFASSAGTPEVVWQRCELPVKETGLTPIFLVARKKNGHPEVTIFVVGGKRRGTS